MKECAFCGHSGKLSAEHIVSNWMESLFPGDLQIRRTDKLGRQYTRKAGKIDWKAKVVCEPCNTTWMSRIEVNHAKPVMTPLITGEVGIPIGPNEARSLAIFAFKTAVVLDHSNNQSDPFFSREARHAFREDKRIPPTVQMWLAGFAKHRGGGRFKTFYHQGQLSASDSLKMHVCTCAIGNFAFQVVAAKDMKIDITLDPISGFESLSVPFWPKPFPGYIWPGVEMGTDLIWSNEQFDAFAMRLGNSGRPVNEACLPTHRKKRDGWGTGLDAGMRGKDGATSLLGYLQNPCGLVE